MNIPRLVLAGTQSGVGKTTISTGIMAALIKRKLNIQPFKVGPDYIDPAFHSYITGNISRNLDSWILDEQTITKLFLNNSQGSDLAIIEGVMGLYDGFGTTVTGSTAHVAKILQSPVILIINGKGISCSAAAQVFGYKQYDPSVNIKGIIINNVSGKKHYDLLKGAIERDTGISCIGYLTSNKDIHLESRHLGLIPTMEIKDLKEKIDLIARMVEETIDLDTLTDIAKGAEDITCTISPIKKPLENINIGVALDKAFHFYYEDNLDLLKELGANLLFFSPLEDNSLPENLHGLYFGGGYPEVFSEELERNESIRLHIKKSIEKGIPTYAECGGLMYLTESITTYEGQRHEMVGIFDTDSSMTNRLQRFGYVNVVIEKPCTIAANPIEVRAHEFHRSTIEESYKCCTAYTVSKANNGEQAWKCGLVKYNALGAYAHMHFYSNRKLAEDFVENCLQYKIRSEIREN